MTPCCSVALGRRALLCALAERPGALVSRCADRRGCGTTRRSAVVAVFGASPLRNLSAQRKKKRTLNALLRQLESVARRQPVVVVFEDAHWIDPTSRELLDLTVEGCAICR
jgi:hypothetical protein